MAITDTNNISILNAKLIHMSHFTCSKVTWGTLPGYLSVKQNENVDSPKVMSTPKAFIWISLSFLHMIHSKFYKFSTDIKVIANLLNIYDFP